MAISWCPLAAVLLAISLSTGNSTAEEEGVSRPAECLLPAETGDCRAFFPQWYYNASLAACKDFIWGGCGGNANRYDSKEDCVRTCQPEVCQLPPEVGPCRANIRMWFYDANNRVCKEFSYGGCKGNENRFASRHSCELACAGTNLRCELGMSFKAVGHQSVIINYREKDWFIVGCERKCREACLAAHAWGVCHAYSTRKRWHSCSCYLFDRHLTDEEFARDTKGVTKNRLCSGGEDD